jgi:hypothetical protein
MKGNKVLIRLITLAIATIMCLVIVQTVSATDPDTVAVWHFDEGIGSTAADATGNGNETQLLSGTLMKELVQQQPMLLETATTEHYLVEDLEMVFTSMG